MEGGREGDREGGREGGREEGRDGGEVVQRVPNWMFWRGGSCDVSCCRTILVYLVACMYKVAPTPGCCLAIFEWKNVTPNRMFPEISAQNTAAPLLRGRGIVINIVVQSHR